MDEFVSKKLLVVKFNELASKYTDGDKRQRGLAYATAADIIAFTDAADVHPIRHGRWKLTNNPSFRKCSECGTWWGKELTTNDYVNYCPRCGVDMREPNE